MSLDQYKMPSGVTEGIIITLDGDPSYEFTVLLPTTFNRPFREAMMNGLEVNAEGQVKQAMGIVDGARRNAFFETCIVRLMKGKTEKDAKGFLEEYPLAGDEIFAKASALATKAETARSGKVEKLKAV